MSFRSLLKLGAAWGSTLALFAASAAMAQSFPSRPITIVLILAPGTGLDIVARSYAERLSQSLGRPVVIENKPGGAQLVAINQLLGAPADGHTLAVVTSGAMAINPALFKKLPYDYATDFVPVSLYLKSPFVLIVDPNLPVRTIQELVAYAKERPGKLSYSSPGIGGAPHLAGAMLNQQYGIDTVHVPYKSTPQSVTDVATGVVQFAFAEAGASQALIKDGRVRALAVTSTTPFSTLPDIPPFAKAAGLPDYEAVSWHVLIARAGAPREALARLHEEMTRIMREPAMKERVASLGLIPIDPMSIEDAQAYIRAEAAKWGGLVRKLGLEGSQ